MNVFESAVDGIPMIVVEGDLDQSSKPAVLDALHNLTIQLTQVPSGPVDTVPPGR